MMCNKDREASLKALIDQDFSKLLEPDAKCDLKPLQKTLISAKLLDIGGVPYMILPSKTVHKGGTKSLKELLENDGGQ